jgi:aminoglycoside phosphotransferase (APT) family kinase protein
VTAKNAGIQAPDESDILQRASSALGEPLVSLHKLPGGNSSLTYRADSSTRRVVVKVAPPGLEPVRNRDVLRQVRVLEALKDVDGLAVPEVLGTDVGEPPAVPPLFVMSFVEGDSYEPLHAVDQAAPRDEDVVERAAAAARMLARMHSVDTAPLVEGGERAYTAADELKRWNKAFATCDLSPELRRSADDAYARLASTVPPAVPPAILHGDWRLGNMLCLGRDILAVVDWEIWSIGDPRVDLAWLRIMSDPTHPTAPNPDAATVGPNGLLTEYEAAAGRPVADMAWFDALIRFKQASTSALLVKNAEKRGESSKQIDKLRSGVPPLLESVTSLVQAHS